MAMSIPAEAQEDKWIGKTLLGDYLIEQLLGKGAMARVYKARQNSTGKYLALKTLISKEPELIARFAKEVEMHGKLKHRNIVETFGCINDASTGQAFFVMELLNGKTLQELVREKGPAASSEAIYAVTSQLCDALSYAHNMDIIHRDLKPANIVVVDTERIELKVVDFGIAKARNDTVALTMPGTVVGSPIYMSPEQCRGLELDQRADVYSLGCLLYELVTGNVPYFSKNIMQVMNSHCRPEVHPKPIIAFSPKVQRPMHLNQILKTALETEREKRFQSVAELKAAVEGWHNAIKLGLDDNAEMVMPKV